MSNRTTAFKGCGLIPPTAPNAVAAKAATRSPTTDRLCCHSHGVAAPAIRLRQVTYELCRARTAHMRATQEGRPPGDREGLLPQGQPRQRAFPSPPAAVPSAGLRPVRLALGATAARGVGFRHLQCCSGTQTQAALEVLLLRERSRRRLATGARIGRLRPRTLRTQVRLPQRSLHFASRERGWGPCFRTLTHNARRWP